MDSGLIKAARDFALAAHAGQAYGPLPYRFHLEMVARLASRYGPRAEAVAWLHDVLEDTHVDYEDLAFEFGEWVAELVRSLTDEPGQNRRERKGRTNEKLRRLPESHEDARAVKACDRLANVWAAALSDPGKLEMYRREHAAFREALRVPGLHEELWEAMDAALGPRPGESAGDGGKGGDL